MDLLSAAGLAVATLGGTAVGVERQWSGHASGPQARFGGIRTFSLLGAVGGLAGWLTTAGLLPLAVVLLAGATALVVAAYVAGSRIQIDGTTEVAAVVVLAAGTLSGTGQMTAGSAVIAVTALLLLEKTRLHALVAHLDDAALRASARFAVLATVVLPLLPQGPFGPYGAVQPRTLWSLVLVFSGLSFIGWIARRFVGPRQGVLVSGLIGGIISSTSVSLTFARESRADAAPRVALAAGVVGASAVMALRVVLACLVLNPAVASALLRYALPPLIVGAGAVLLAWRLSPAPSREGAAAASPLQLGAALQMAGLFQLVLFAIAVVRDLLGPTALIATSAVVGMTDLDALTASIAQSARTSADIPLYARALASGMLANTLLKLTVALVVGRGAFRAVAVLGLGAMALVLGIALMV